MPDKCRQRLDYREQCEIIEDNNGFKANNARLTQINHNNGRLTNPKSATGGLSLGKLGTPRRAELYRTARISHVPHCQWDGVFPDL